MCFCTVHCAWIHELQAACASFLPGTKVRQQLAVWYSSTCDWIRARECTKDFCALTQPAAVSVTPAMSPGHKCCPVFTIAHLCLTSLYGPGVGRVLLSERFHNVLQPAQAAVRAMCQTGKQHLTSCMPGMLTAKSTRTIAALPKLRSALLSQHCTLYVSSESCTSLLQPCSGHNAQVEAPVPEDEQGPPLQPLVVGQAGGHHEWDVLRRHLHRASRDMLHSEIKQRSGASTTGTCCEMCRSPIQFFLKATDEKKNTSSPLDPSSLQLRLVPVNVLCVSRL